MHATAKSLSRSLIQAYKGPSNGLCCYSFVIVNIISANFVGYVAEFNLSVERIQVVLAAGSLSSLNQ